MKKPVTEKQFEAYLKKFRDLSAANKRTYAAFGKAERAVIQAQKRRDAAKEAHTKNVNKMVALRRKIKELGIEEQIYRRI